MGRVLGGGGGGFSSSCGGDSLRLGGPLGGSLGDPLGRSLGGPLGGSPCAGDHLCGAPAPLRMGDCLVSWFACPALLFDAGGAGHDM